MSFIVDIELTNRCNASCYFCPRDQTPHQGLMSPEVFDRSLARTIEFREVVGTTLSDLGDEVRVSLCGLGEPLLNKHVGTFARQVADAGFSCAVSTNGALLDERRGAALLEGGVDRVFINVGDIDEAYEDVYKLPFERTQANVLRFKEMAGDSCEVIMVLVNYKGDKRHLHLMRKYWREHGVKDSITFDVMNRGGALFVDHMQFEAYSELAEATAMLDARGCEAICGAPFGYLFIGYDGQYYLCCSDWKKEVPMGSIFDLSFADVAQQKLDHVLSREPVCKTCNHDPVNRLTSELHARAAGDETEHELDALVDEIANGTAFAREIANRLIALPPSGNGRRRIPVVAADS